MQKPLTLEDRLREAATRKTAWTTFERLCKLGRNKAEEKHIHMQSFTRWNHMPNPSSVAAYIPWAFLCNEARKSENSQE